MDNIADFSKQQITPCIPHNLRYSPFDHLDNLKNHSSPSPPSRSHTGNLLASSLPFWVSVLKEVKHFVKGPGSNNYITLLVESPLWILKILQS